jgi:hypothetical protein
MMKARKIIAGIITYKPKSTRNETEATRGRRCTTSWCSGRNSSGSTDLDSLASGYTGIEKMKSAVIGQNLFHNLFFLQKPKKVTCIPANYTKLVNGPNPSALAPPQTSEN